MNIVQTIRAALADPSVKASATFNDLVRSNLPPQTPPYTISGLEPINFRDPAVRENIARIIFQNLSTYNQVLCCSTTWRHLLDAIENCLVPASYVSDYTLNAKLSFLLVMTKMKASVIMSISWAVDKVVAEQYEVPPIVIDLLRSKKSTTSFRNSTSPYFTAAYPIPSTVLSVTINTERVCGWVCLSGCVAIHRSCTENLNEFQPIRTLSLFNLLGHEMQHGIVRAAMEDFNTHTPELIRGRRTALEKSCIERMVECCAWWRRFTGEPAQPNMYEEPESGCRWERGVWNGVCPRWMDPIDPEAARALATKILNTFATHEDILLDKDDMIAMHMSVGSWSTYGGAMYYRGEVSRLF